MSCSWFKAGNALACSTASAVVLPMWCRTAAHEICKQSVTPASQRLSHLCVMRCAIGGPSCTDCTFDPWPRGKSLQTHGMLFESQGSDSTRLSTPQLIHGCARPRGSSRSSSSGSPSRAARMASPSELSTGFMPALLAPSAGARPTHLPVSDITCGAVYPTSSQDVCIGEGPAGDGCAD